MRFLKLLLLSTLTISTIVIADPNIFWEQSYGFGFNDFGNDVKQTADGGYILTGSAGDSGQTVSKILLVKTDAEGNLEWMQSYGGGDLDSEGNSVVQTGDGGYLIAGATDIVPYDLEMNLFILKTDANGDSIWSYTYDAGEIDRANSIVLLNDGCFIAAGETGGHFTGGSGDAILIKFDPEGNVLWVQNYDFEDCDTFFNAVLLDDGGFIIAGGSCFDDYSCYAQILLARTDSEGNLLWSQDYGWGISRQVIPVSTGGFALGGWSSQYIYGSENFFLIKTDDNGDLLWRENWGTFWTQIMGGMVETPDGGFIMTGSSFEPDIYDSYCLYTVKTDAEGLTLGEWRYSSSGGYENGDGIIAADDGNYLITGCRPNQTATGMAAFLLKIDGQLESMVANITPEAFPITIPAQGGQFTYDLQLMNGCDVFQILDIEIEIQGPYPLIYEIISLQGIDLQPGQILERENVVQMVPSRAEPGDYYYSITIYEHGTLNLIATDQFYLNKLETDENIPDIPGGWEIEGMDDLASEPNTVPGDFLIMSVYPNPFNPAANISYYLPEAAEIGIIIYDVQGKTVSVLADGWNNAGYHQVSFDGSGLSSGIYFSRLTSGDNTAVKKLILAK